MPTLTVLLALTGVAEALNVTVPTQQPTVSAAVAALTGPGPHTIQITVDNTYTEPGTIDVSGMDVTIVGTGAETTVIRLAGAGTSPVFRVTNGRLVIDDLTLTGDLTGQAAGVTLVDNLCNFATDRRGIQATSSTVEIYDAELRCFFSKSAGGAINTINSDLVIDGAYFEQNIALGAGGHIFVGGNTVSPPEVNISNSEFHYGFSISDGGAISLGNAESHINRNRFFNNDSVVQGGAVALHNSIVVATEVYENTFQENHSVADLSFTVFDFAEAFESGSASGTIDFDLLVGEGGAVYANTETIDMWANLFCGNFSDKGGAVYLDKPPLSVVENNVFNDNWSVHYGGGLYLSGATGMVTPDVFNNTFYANSAGYLPPPSSELVVFGAGGGAFFDGTVPDFHNNMVADQQHGGGVGGIDGPAYIIGDPLIMKYNLWYLNTEDFSGGYADLVGDFASHTLNQTNVLGNNPYPTFANYEDLDCYPDAFYPVWGSPAVNNGDDTDTSWADIDGSRNDIGFTGGSRAPVVDRDGDGYNNTLDCNDIDPNVNPGENELCDLQDNDCDGEVDEGYDNTWYVDNDGDGFGTNDPNVGVLVQCAPPAGYVADGGDCNDDPNNGGAAINPTASEICDGIDNDCNGTIDDEELLDYKSYYADNDGDGFGISQSYTEACESPGAGFVEISGDCNDTEPTVYPGATELCDGFDNDCDGLPDNDSAEAKEWFIDEDGDGYGVGTSGPVQCDPPGGANYANMGGDCDDAETSVNPGESEVCGDELDNDCDGLVDNDPDPSDPDAVKYYEDSDGDGFYDDDSMIVLCDGAEVPEGFAKANAYEGEDCDTKDATNQSEACYKDCSCQTGATPGSTGMLALLGGLLLGLRRRE